jgi:hypothetical protein
LNEGSSFYVAPSLSVAHKVAGVMLRSAI